MLRVHLVRHGQTVWNAVGRLQGQTDVPLSDEGLRQADLLADRLRADALSGIWSSDLERALRTAERIAEPHGLRVRVTPALREAYFGCWEGLTEADIVARGEGERLAAYRRDAEGGRPPGSEPLDVMWARLTRALEAIRDEARGGTIVVVGHGGSMRVLVCEALGAPPASVRRLHLGNASLSTLEYGGHCPRVTLLNDTSHLRAQERASPTRP
ncbi:MAG: histidine phosphatase family protein [Chthonomonadales bacterium]|nr:histidine phosphatase family protein [Chthonomonadales bacterium]